MGEIFGFLCFVNIYFVVFDVELDVVIGKFGIDVGGWEMGLMFWFVWCFDYVVGEGVEGVMWK